MPAILDRCVQDLMNKGKSEDSAFAICRASLNLSQDEEEIMRIARNMAKKDFALPKTHAINGVEVFAAGVWNGDKYTLQDLDDMVNNFQATKKFLKPFLGNMHHS